MGYEKNLTKSDLLSVNRVGFLPQIEKSKEKKRNIADASDSDFVSDGASALFYSREKIRRVKRQIIIPRAVGISTESSVSIVLLLSFFIVSSVVEQGNLKIVITSVFTQVSIVQPFALSIPLIPSEPPSTLWFV